MNRSRWSISQRAAEDTVSVRRQRCSRPPETAGAQARRLMLALPSGLDPEKSHDRYGNRRDHEYHLCPPTLCADEAPRIVERKRHAEETPADGRLDRTCVLLDIRARKRKKLRESTARSRSVPRGGFQHRRAESLIPKEPPSLRPSGPTSSVPQVCPGCEDRRALAAPSAVSGAERAANVACRLACDDGPTVTRDTAAHMAMWNRSNLRSGRQIRVTPGYIELFCNHAYD